MSDRVIASRDTFTVVPDREWVFNKYMEIHNRALTNGDLEIALKALDSISSEISNQEWIEHKKTNPGSVLD